MSVFERIPKAIRVLRGSSQSGMDMKKASQALDVAIKEGLLPVGPVEEKAAKPSSRRDIQNNDRDLAYYGMYNLFSGWFKATSQKLAELDVSKLYRLDPMRDEILSEVWRHEPILSGAIYSMIAKMISLRWTITGKRRNAIMSARMLARASHMGGYDWGGFISSTAEDFYTTNRGVFWELAKGGDPLFSVAQDIGHMDALCCTLTGNSEEPVQYNGYFTGQQIRFKPGEFVHFASLPSPRERYIGHGFCAVDRAFKAAQLLMGLHSYDMEKLNNLPPEGVAAISGLTMDEFQDALKLWQAARKSNQSLTFPQVLWLLGSMPNSAVDVKMIGFSQLPESFDRKSVVDQYINIVSLDLGVDAREFWTLSGGGLGSAGESEIQHLKAKGKGPGEFITTAERHINGELPEETFFAFDTQDIEEDANAAAVAKAWVDAYMPLYNLAAKSGPGGGNSPTGKPENQNPFEEKANPRPDKPNGEPSNPTPMIQGVDTGGNMSSMSGGQPKQAEQVIDKEQFLRLLADKGVLPDWMVHDDRVVVADTEIHNSAYKSEGHPDDATMIVWKGGRLTEERLPAINLYSKEVPTLDDEVIFPGGGHFHSPDALLTQLLQRKEKILEENRNIHGDPIPPQEALRGSRVTSSTIKAEIERWRNDPVLSQYLDTDDVQKIIRNL